MSIKFEKNQNKKNYSQIKVKKKLVINPQHTLLGLKRALPIIEEISFRGGTILLVGSNTKYRKLMQQYAFEVNQPYMYRSWVNGLLSNDTLLKDHLMKYGFKIDRAPMSDWLRRNKVTDFLMKYEGYINVLKKPSLVIFLNTSRLSDALAEANSLNIPSIGLSTTAMDASALTYPIPSNDHSMKTLALFLELVKKSIKTGATKRKLLLNHISIHESKKKKKNKKKK